MKVSIKKLKLKSIDMIILKVTKNQGFTLSLEGAFLEKPQEDGGGGGWQIDPPRPFKVNKVQKAHNSIFWINKVVKLSVVRISNFMTSKSGKPFNTNWPFSQIAYLFLDCNA